MKVPDESSHSPSRWRVGHVGRDRMYYDEFRDGKWERLELDCEMLMGRAHHVIYFGTRKEWKQRPKWARERRDEIIDRIKSTFRVPDYEYNGEGILADSDRRFLIDAAGGLSGSSCRYAGCSERALKEKAICVYHSFPPHVWRQPAAQQGVEPDVE